jgi:hypothetical protein
VPPDVTCPLTELAVGGVAAGLRLLVPEELLEPELALGVLARAVAVAGRADGVGDADVAVALVPVLDGAGFAAA